MGERSDPLRMERRTLDSGLELVLQSPPASAHSFSISYLAPAGSGYDPAGAEGLAAVAGKMLVGMPGRRTREELARLLDRLGASLTCSVAPESAEVTAWGPEETWKPIVGVFADAVLRPRFDREELGRTLRQLRERQLRQQVQPDLRAERELLSAIFPKGHPYRSTGLGSPRTSARISLEGLRRFHQRHYPARSSVLVVTARGPREPLVRSLERWFPAHELCTAPDAPPLLERPRPSGRVDIPIKGQSQVAVRIGAPSVARSDPRHAELFLVNEVLGGRPLLSRLFQRIREKHGLAYHASSELEAMRWGGYWQATAGTDPSTRNQVVRLMLEEIDRLSGATIPVGELDRIRESCLGSLPLELETTASAHELAADVAYHRLPGDFYRRWPTLLRSIRPPELRRAAEVGFSSEHAVVITAGPSES